MNISTHGIPMELINAMIKNLYKNNEKVMKNSAFVPSLFGFQRCITSLMRPYDLRDFFGGMVAYHDGQRMASILGIRTPFSFARNFVDGRNGQADPVMIAARVPRFKRASPDVQLTSSHYAEADFCISLRIWDALLWFSIMQRPRRDVGICADFANTLAECSVHLLPRSIFPYDVVPTTRVDHIDKTQVPMTILFCVHPFVLAKTLMHIFCEQVLMDTQFNEEKYGGLIHRPEVIPRHINPGIATPHFNLQCSGRVGTKVLEDEMYMSEVIMMAEDMGIEWHQFPLDQTVTMCIHWEYGVCYPLIR